jgi:hypothetical protein
LAAAAGLGWLVEVPAWPEVNSGIKGLSAFPGAGAKLSEQVSERPKMRSLPSEEACCMLILSVGQTNADAVALL